MVGLAAFLIPLALEDEVKQSIVRNFEGSVLCVGSDDGVSVGSEGDVVQIDHERIFGDGKEVRRLKLVKELVEADRTVQETELLVPDWVWKVK